jgi:DNA primase
LPLLGFEFTGRLSWSILLDLMIDEIWHSVLPFSFTEKSGMSFQSVKEEIKRAADIVELIGQSVQLRKAGRNHVGLCPFHSEKDPSFTVNSERQTFHCFGCKRGGDIFSFWMEYHGASFTEALRDLAERYQIRFTGQGGDEREREQTRLREAIFRVNETAAAYYQSVLGHPADGKAARAYLDKRGVSQETVAQMGLGYAPDQWDGLAGLLRKQRADLKAAVDAGLLVQGKSGGFYDRFRNRIIFPILDLRKRVIGFGGRVLDQSLPKYLNTPETAVFHKGESLYGLHLSHPAIREKGRAVVVEGYMDFIALKGQGVQEGVATLGTALTESHVRRLKGFAKQAVVVFDADTAGKAAALRSLPVFANEGLPARAVVLPKGHDPDTFVSQKGRDAFVGLLEQAPSLFDFYLDQKAGEAASEEEKVRAARELLPVLGQIRDFALRSLYVRRLSERSGIREGILLSELESTKPAENTFETDPLGDKGRRDGPRIGDQQFLNLLVHHPSTTAGLADADYKVVLSDPVIMDIVDRLFEMYRREGVVAAERLLDHLEKETSRQKLREVLHQPVIFSDEDRELAISDFRRQIERLKIAASIQEAKRSGDLTRLAHLIRLKAEGV